MKNNENLLNIMSTDIKELISSLEYLDIFCSKISEDNELDVYSKLSIIHTEIKLLNSKIKRK